MLMSRSSLEKPRPLDRFSRTTSPSRISIGTSASSSLCSTICAIVVLPDPDSPVNQMTHPRSRFACLMSLFLSPSDDRGPGLFLKHRGPESAWGGLETEQVEDRRMDVPQMQTLLRPCFLAGSVVHDEDALLGVVRLVGAGVVLERVDRSMSHRPDRTPLQLAEDHDEIRSHAVVLLIYLFRLERLVAHGVSVMVHHRLDLLD